ncbi:5938_t:CDS:2 [Cetraspora pellucida]|uniref:5938_t:CDS:1 n=1 Tax=Cetraspora pellucida TaxID=1433469 RepID=A0A9N9CLV1_9GLOM|nr:5938_t:CDS:2 [Cetraspora pellucida]
MEFIDYKGTSKQKHVDDDLTKKCVKCSFRRHHKDADSQHCVYCDLLLQIPQSEYVPYEHFINIKYLSEGGFSKIYKATWKDGPLTSWYSKKQRFHRHKNCTVVLKSLNDSKYIGSDFLNEYFNS